LGGEVEDVLKSPVHLLAACRFNFLYKNKVSEQSHFNSGITSKASHLVCNKTISKKSWNNAQTRNLPYNLEQVWFFVEIA
jgi:hypothetical protein